MNPRQQPQNRGSSRKFFLRGLGILLPTVLTIWILTAVYSFVDQKIAMPINAGVKEVILRGTNLPVVSEEAIYEFDESLTSDQRSAKRAASNQTQWLELQTRRQELNRAWSRISIGNWAVLDVFGLLVAVVLIYMVGLVLGSYIGHAVYRRGEELLKRVPFFRHVYPYVKQVTDFLVGDGDQKLEFNRVVAVQYPRKGLWSIGLVTGDTLKEIQTGAKTECMTVFIPSSPTPFTGYVITVPVEDTIELPITIDDALRFTVSGGVIVPDGQVIQRGGPSPAATLAEEAAHGRQEPTGSAANDLEHR
ncbi:MAG: DUF502 domain-containing protein [Phycisphaeraceae bacterium]